MMSTRHQESHPLPVVIFAAQRKYTDTIVVQIVTMARMIYTNRTKPYVVECNSKLVNMKYISMIDPNGKF